MAFELVPYNFARRDGGLGMLERFFDLPHIHVADWDWNGFEFPMDVTENKDMVVVEAEVAGLRAKDLDISLTGDILTIKGEKKATKTTEDDGCYCTERPDFR